MQKLSVLGFAFIAAASMGPEVGLAADFGGALPYEVPARERARVQSATTQAYANGTVQREIVNVTQFYGLRQDQEIKCDAGTLHVDTEDLMPGQRVEAFAAMETVINVCGR